MTITKGKVTEIIIKVDDSFLEQTKLKGMESKYELIRCKDCKYHTAYNECTNKHWDSTQSPDYPVVDEKDYCSFAERKEK